MWAQRVNSSTVKVSKKMFVKKLRNINAASNVCSFCADYNACVKLTKSWRRESLSRGRKYSSINWPLSITDLSFTLASFRTCGRRGSRSARWFRSANSSRGGIEFRKFRAGFGRCREVSDELWNWTSGRLNGGSARWKEWEKRTLFRSITSPI